MSRLYRICASPSFLALSCGDGKGGDTDENSEDSGQVVWSPGPGTAWQLQGKLDTSLDVEMYDIDLFDTALADIGALQAAGRVVVCYFSAGSREDWRADADAFEASDHGNDLDGWAGETWLDVRSGNVRSIMEARLDLAVQKGCDGVEPDNVDGYANDSGFDLSAADQIDYDRFLAIEARARGLSVGLKNALGIVPELEPEFDWALNEECPAWQECEVLAPFLAADKAVFHTESVDDAADGGALADEVCSDPATAFFSTLIKTWDLDAWVLTCESAR
jgi:hypothetical protein